MEYGVRMINGYKRMDYTVKREGNKITASAGFQDQTVLFFKGDTVHLSGKEVNCTISMAPNGLTVTRAAKHGLRSLYPEPAIREFSPMSLKPEQYEAAALSVASALTGIPLFAAASRA